MQVTSQTQPPAYHIHAYPILHRIPLRSRMQTRIYVQKHAIGNTESEILERLSNVSRASARNLALPGCAEDWMRHCVLVTS